MMSFANGKCVIVAMIATVLMIRWNTRPAIAAYVDEVLADNPIAYWRLGEESGTVANDLGTVGATGTYVNVTIGEPSLIATDPDNTAARFDGQSSMVVIPRDGGTGEYSNVNERSIVLWFKADDVDRKVTDWGYWDEQILHEQGTGGLGLSIYVHYGHVYVGDWNIVRREWKVFLGTPISSGEIYQVALVRKYDRSARVGTLTGYLNGQPFAEDVGVYPLPPEFGGVGMTPYPRHGETVTGIGAMVGHTKTVTLGPGGDGLYFQGVIDEVAVYDTALSSDRILAQYMAATGDFEAFLQAGDANMDYQFDQLDLVQVQVAAKYLTGQTATWGEGDWNGAPGGSPGDPPVGNGLFDQFDIIAAQQAGAYLTGAYAAIASDGIRSDGQTSVVYDASTGDLAVDAPFGTELTSINIDSAAAISTGKPEQNLGGSFDNDADNNLFKATFGDSFGSLSFGNVAQLSLSEDFVLSDLSVVGSLAGRGNLGDLDLIYVPEPTTFVLMGLALAGAVMMCGRGRA